MMSPFQQMESYGKSLSAMHTHGIVGGLDDLLLDQCNKSVPDVLDLTTPPS
jgi:hypothetical protein